VIAGYKCKKATSSFEQGLEAWFTNEVPINAGPKTYSGLPGLIIKVNSEYLAIEATDVEVSDNPIKIKVPSKGKKVSRKKFNEIRDKKENRNKDNEGSISIKVIQM
jgi:GLPGLI family protein